MSITIDVRKSNGETRIVDIAGDIDIYSSSLVKAALLELFEKQHHNVLVNLEKVRSIDSTGLAVLIGALKRSRTDDGRLDLICANPLILKVFDITGLAKAFTIFGDEGAALATPAKAVRA